MNIHNLPVEIWQRIFSDFSVREKIHMVVADGYFRGAVDIPNVDRAKEQLYCRGCKMAPINGLYEDHRCVDCYDGDTTITASRALRVFGLRPRELGELPYQNQLTSPHDVLDRRGLFKFKDVRAAALKKYGKRMSDAWLDLEAERQREKAARDAEEAECTEKLRAGLANFGVQLDEECAHVAREYLKMGEGYEAALSMVQEHIRSERESAPRAAIINERLDALGIDRRYYSELREKHAKNWAGYRDLERVVQIITDTWKLERELSGADPRQKLERALALRGVELDTDEEPGLRDSELHSTSRLCQEYLDGESRSHLTLPSIVEVKFEMHLLQKHTNYEECCKDALVPVYEYRSHFRYNMTYFCEDLEKHCLAALGAQDEVSARREPLCRCGLSSATVHSQGAIDYVYWLYMFGPPPWMHD